MIFCEKYNSVCLSVMVNWSTTRWLNQFNLKACSSSAFRSLTLTTPTRLSHRFYFINFRKTSAVQRRQFILCQYFQWFMVVAFVFCQFYSIPCVFYKSKGYILLPLVHNPSAQNSNIFNPKYESTLTFFHNLMCFFILYPQLSFIFIIACIVLS